jgi:hypothetical protein
VVVPNKNLAERLENWISTEPNRRGARNFHATRVKPTLRAVFPPAKNLIYSRAFIANTGQPNG